MRLSTIQEVLIDYLIAGSSWDGSKQTLHISPRYVLEIRPPLHNGLSIPFCFRSITTVSSFMRLVKTLHCCRWSCGWTVCGAPLEGRNFDLFIHQSRIPECSSRVYRSDLYLHFRHFCGFPRASGHASRSVYSMAFFFLPKQMN